MHTLKMTLLCVLVWAGLLSVLLFALVWTWEVAITLICALTGSELPHRYLGTNAIFAYAKNLAIRLFKQKNDGQSKR
jgi:hypothetical protein